MTDDTDLDPPSSLPEKGRTGLVQTAMSGVSWLIGQSLSARLIGFVSQIALARLLAPSDFAILALAGTVTTLIGMLVNFGVDDVLLQRQARIRFWRLPAVIVTFVLGLVSMAVVIAVSPLAAKAYHSDILVPMLAVMALGMPISSLSMVPTAELRKSLNFRFLAAYNTGDLIAQQVLTIGFALLHFGPFSFAIPGPILATVRSIVFWWVTRPKLQRMKRRQLGMIGARGSIVFGTKIVTALVGQGDYMVLGFIAEKPVVGAYFFAYRLAFQPISMLAGSISSVLFPALATVQNESRQGEIAVEVSQILALVAMPLCFLQAALAPSLLILVFGHRWSSAIPLVQVLSIALAFDAVSWVAGALLNARGEFKRSFLYSCLFSPAFFIFVLAGALERQALGTAMAVLVYYGIGGPLYSYFVFRSVGVRLWSVVTLYLQPAAVSLVAIGGPYMLSQSLGPLARMAVVVGAGVPLSCAGFWLLSPALCKKLISRFARRF